jgi:DNA helicase-2/ATP-dependent DNA helicase PcrA
MWRPFLPLQALNNLGRKPEVEAGGSEMDPPAYLPSYLTTEQFDAIVHQGSPLLIIAGPGSGKTEVITWRVMHLVRAGLVTPEHLLVTTFTNKAALELKDRIQQRLADVHVEAMQVGTLHAFCADLLRQHQSRSPLPRGFHILDEHGQFLFVYSQRKALGLDALVKGRPYDFFSNVLRLFSLATEELVEPERLGEWCECCRAEAEVSAAELAGGRSKTKAEKAAGEVERWCEEKVVVEAYRHYVDLLRERGLADFAFLQRHAYDLLTVHPEVVADLRGRYRAILVDEYQDTNAVQERLLKLLARDGNHLTVVGDDDQSIYRFRGATVRNLLDFPRSFPGARVVRLTENFRSREPIVAHSLNVITHNPARFEKSLFTQRGPGSDVLLVYERSVDEEAAALAGLLHRLHGAGKVRRWSDVVILLRSVRSYAASYTDALRAAGIPVVVTGDATLFQRDDVGQLVNLFTFLGATKPWGDVHVRQPVMNLDEATVAALQAFPGSLLDLDETGWQEIGVTSPADRRKLSALLALKRRVQAREHPSLLAVFYDLLAITGYAARCERIGDLEALLNLGVFSRLVTAFDEYAGTRTLYPFLDYLKLMREGGVDPAVVEPEDAMRVMTIHQAKGLEFPVVVVASAMDGRLPSTRRREHYEVPHELRASGPPEVEDPHLVDERKLFYVAATRARDLLILGTADVVNKRGGGPSPFLVEMLGEDLHAAVDLSQARVAEIESRAGPAAGPRERLSFSQLAYFLQCPVRFKFAVVYGLELPRPDPVDFGANVHRALLTIHERAQAGQIPQPAEIEEIVAAAWVAALQADPVQDRQAQKAAVRQLQHYVAHHTGSLTQVVQAEAGFSFGLERHVLVGKIDLLRQADGGHELVDFKAGRSAPAALEQVDAQLDLYALGAESSLKLPIVQQSVHFLEDDQVHTWAWSPARAESARKWLGSLLDQITRREFPPRPAYCPHCAEFRAICPYGEGQR